MMFDEAYNMLNLETANAGYWGSAQYSLVHAVLAGLNETYAKPVEMNKAQVKKLMRLRLVLFGLFEDVRGDEAFEDFRTEDLMRAWLHPELIKVVG